MRAKQPNGRIPRFSRNKPITPDPVDFSDLKQFPEYVPLRPARPAPAEHWYDSRYEPPADHPGPHAPPPYGTWQPSAHSPADYARMPGPTPGMFDGRIGPRPAPYPDPVPDYDDGRLTRAGSRAAWESALTPPPIEVPFHAPPGHEFAAPAAGAAAHGPGDLPPEPSVHGPTPFDPAAAFADPLAPRVGPLPPLSSEPLLEPGHLAGPAIPDFGPALDYPVHPGAAALEQQMQPVFPEPPVPEPFPDPFGGLGGLEQRLLEPQLPDLFEPPAPPGMFWY